MVVQRGGSASDCDIACICSQTISHKCKYVQLCKRVLRVPGLNLCHLACSDPPRLRPDRLSCTCIACALPSCVSGCSCAAKVVDANYDQRYSVTLMTLLKATQATACVLQVGWWAERPWASVPGVLLWEAGQGTAMWSASHALVAGLAWRSAAAPLRCHPCPGLPRATNHRAALMTVASHAVLCCGVM